MRILLAVDAGGTSTRAAIIDAAGPVLGVGRAASGNPTSAGIRGAVDGIGTAAERAFDSAGIRPDGDSAAVVALAGANSPAFREHLHDRLVSLGLSRAPTIESDLLGMYFSGTYEEHGYAVIAGTGAVAARVSHGELALVSGGTGWLLGDAGSGFWIGHHVVRAVAAALDGQGAETVLTSMLSKSLGLHSTTGTVNGRPLLLDRLIAELYELRPVEMSRFAPLAFEATDDPVARGIIDAAIHELIDLLSVVLDPKHPGPIIVGGSVLKHGILGPGREPIAATFRDRLAARAPDASVVAVSDGLIGACVLALRHAGISVTPEAFASVQTQLVDAPPGPG